MATSPQTIRIDPNDNPAQEAFARADTKETYYFGGVGSGKTVGGVMRLARHIYEWNPGEQLAIVTPTVPMMRNVIIPELQKWGLYREEWHQKTENRLEYPNGTTVILESAANLQKVERLRGLSIAGAWLDEIGEHYEKTYHVIGDRLRTGDYRNLWGTGTPKGKNWVYEECVQPLLHDDATQREAADGTLLQNDYMTTIKGVSTRANRATPADYKTSRERQHSGHSYKQEIEGEFVEPEGLVYGWFSDDHLAEELPDDYERVIYGVDWGFNAPAAAVAILECDGGYYIADEVYVREATADEFADHVEGLVEEFGTGPIYCDPAEPASIEHFRKRGLSARQAENDVIPGIQHVTAQREDLQVHEQCRNWRNEVSGYEWKDDGKDRPVKANDHLMDSTRYALFTHQTGQTVRRRSGGSPSTGSFR